MIWVDHREINSGVVEALKTDGLDILVKSLPAGDYVVDNRVFIERKTTKDFIRSIIDGRLFGQAAKLNKFGDKQLFIIEGLHPGLSSGINKKAVEGAIISLAVSWQLPILYCDCPRHTAFIIGLIHAQITKSAGMSKEKTYWQKKSDNRELQKKKILESMPMIGPHLANELLSSFGSLNKVFEASVDELKDVHGIGRKKAEKIKWMLKENRQAYVTD
jgi:Fanconi anemia group M protein